MRCVVVCVCAFPYQVERERVAEEKQPQVEVKSICEAVNPHVGVKVPSAAERGPQARSAHVRDVRNHWVSKRATVSLTLG